MAPRRPTPPQPQRANLTDEQMKLGITRLQRRIVDLRNFNPKIIQKRDGPEVKTLETAIEETLALVFGHNTVEYNRYKDAAELDQGPRIMRIESSWIAARGGGREYHNEALEAQQYVAEGIERSVMLLQQAVRGLEEEIVDRGGLTPAHTFTSAPPPQTTIADEPIPDAALNEIRAALDEIKTKLPTFAVSNTVKTDIHVDIEHIEAEVERPTPRRHLVKVFLESLRDNLAVAAATGLGALVGTILARYFGVL
jgi:hypothetical protein